MSAGLSDNTAHVIQDSVGPDTYRTDSDYIEIIRSDAMRIISDAGESGFFLNGCNRQSREIIQLQSDARNCAARIRARLEHMPAGDALSLLSLYDMVHRIGCGSPADRDLTDKIKINALNALAHGDRSVDEYILFREIGEELRRGNRRFFGNILQWYCMSVERWHRNFPDGHCAKEQTDYDTLRQLSILLREDLGAYETDLTAYRKRLVGNHRRYLASTPAGTDRRTAEALAEFQTAARLFLPATDHFILHLTQ